MDLNVTNSSLDYWKQQHSNETSGDSQTLNYDLNYDSVYDDYNYFSADTHEELLSSIHQQTSAFAVFLAILTFAVNVLIITACLGNKNTRHNGYYNQIVNLSISNIAISLFVLPLTVYHIQHAWDLGQLLCKMYVISDVLLPFTSIIIIIILNIDRLMSKTHPNLHSWIFQKTLKKVTVCMPWIVSVIVVIPIWTSGTVPYENGPGECIVLISNESAILCPLITFFIPLVCIVALTFKLLMLKIQLSSASPGTLETTRMSLKNQQIEIGESGDFTRRSSALPSTSTTITEDNRDDIVALCIVNTMFLIMWFPFQFISFLLSFCQAPSCIPSLGLNQVVTWIGASSAGVVPVFWLIDSKLRSSIRINCVKQTQLDFRDSAHSEETFL